jgi:DNA-binding transcriptional LysR family regulator
VSKTIAQLGDRLAVGLRVGTTHTLCPTAAGMRLYARANLAIVEVDEAVIGGAGRGAGLSGRLRVRAATTFRPHRDQAPLSDELARLRHSIWRSDSTTASLARFRR